MFQLTKNSKIYIVAPPAEASGGPELLHQLCNALCRRGFQAYMCYSKKNSDDIFTDNPVHEKYKIYNTKFVKTVEDEPQNLLIVPEMITRPLALYKTIQKCVWWLGANNYFWLKEIDSHKYWLWFAHHIRKLLGMKTPLTFRQIKKETDYHLSQCWYTAGYLERKGIHNVVYLSDYLSPIFLTDENISGRYMKEDMVLYNPSRNMKYIHKLEAAAPEIKFVAIHGMTAEQVLKLMQKAKVYIDFGAHPGKDRMPREAAMCGCCIITSTLGSADFFDDVPVYSEFKFERTKKNIPRVIKKIKYIFSNYEKEIIKFTYYRQYIMQEKNCFEKDIDKLFFVEKA